MVTREYMARSARRWFRRKGTEMARAMLRALGVRCEGPRIDAPRMTEDYTERGEIMECFENRESPMDAAIA